MNRQSDDQIDGKLKSLSAELDDLKGQIARQAHSFETLLARLATVPGAAPLLESSDDKPVQPRHFVAASISDPKLIRRIIRLRQRRAKLFPAAEFADPAWDMLLDLAAARAERKRVSVTSLCLASGVPPTTALRWISHMIEARYFVRKEDQEDRRRVYVGLTETAEKAMARYFDELLELAD